VQEALSVASKIRGTDAFNQLKKLEFLNMLYQSTSHGEYQPKTVLRYLALNLLEKTETEEDARKLYRFLNTQLGELTSFETISKTKTVFDIITEGVG
jgi:DNA-binding IclR family transcriptional regulator